jgi:hypothetical protein
MAARRNTTPRLSKAQKSTERPAYQIVGTTPDGFDVLKPKMKSPHLKQIERIVEKSMQRHGLLRSD